MPCFLTPEWWKKRVSGSSLGSKSPQLATSRGSPGGREDLWGQTRKRLRLGSTRRNWDPQPPAIIGHQSKKTKKTSPTIQVPNPSNLQNLLWTFLCTTPDPPTKITPPLLQRLKPSRTPKALHAQAHRSCMASSQVAGPCSPCRPSISKVHRVLGIAAGYLSSVLLRRAGYRSRSPFEV